jgi:hypothetical protein
MLQVPSRVWIMRVRARLGLVLKLGAELLSVLAGANESETLLLTAPVSCSDGEGGGVVVGVAAMPRKLCVLPAQQWQWLGTHCRLQTRRCNAWGW